MVEKASGYGLQKILALLGSGLFQSHHIHDMDKRNIPSIIMVKGQKKLVAEIILDCKGSFESGRDKKPDQTIQMLWKNGSRKALSFVSGAQVFSSVLFP